jgi:LmbE family N-acetylglucosaminyl deacetylase
MRLIVAPHADDEVLGCGGLLAKYPDECWVAVLSDKNDGRMTEFYRAKGVLRYKHSTKADFVTGELAARSREVTTWLDQLIKQIKPNELYLPTPGAHQDHIAAYESGVRAARLSYTNGAWFVPAVFLYEIPSYSTDLYTIPYPWNRFEVLTEEHMDAKAKAIEAYASQMNGAFNPAHFAREHARFIGAQRNVAYAEQFAVVREVRA